MSSAKISLLAALIPVLPLLGMRRKATETVDFSDESTKEPAQGNSSLFVGGVEGEAPCPGMMWTLAALEGTHSDGWKGVNMLLSACDDTLLLNASLSGSELPFNHRICLPGSFKIEVRNNLGLASNSALRWQLGTEGGKSLSGGAPFSQSLCEATSVADLRSEGKEQQPSQASVHEALPSALDIVGQAFKDYKDYYMANPQATIDRFVQTRSPLMLTISPIVR